MKILAIFTILAVLFLATESREYDYHLTLKPNVFDVYWSHNITDIGFRRFYFKFVAKTTGWAALGWSDVADGKYMSYYDIALGGVRNGNDTYLGDYYSQGYPSAGGVLDIYDRIQSLVLTNATEADGYTTIEFNRQANTFKNDDISFVNNTRMWLMWAIAPTDATGPNTYVKHKDKDYTRVAYNMFTGEQLDAPVSTTSKPNVTSGTGTMTSSVAMYLISPLLVEVLLHLGTVLMLD